MELISRARNHLVVILAPDHLSIMMNFRKRIQRQGLIGYVKSKPLGPGQIITKVLVIVMIMPVFHKKFVKDCCSNRKKERKCSTAGGLGSQQYNSEYTMTQYNRSNRIKEEKYSSAAGGLGIKGIVLQKKYNCTPLHSTIYIVQEKGRKMQQHSRRVRNSTDQGQLTS